MMSTDLNKLKSQDKLFQGISTIGIDIGTSSVNVAQMAKLKGQMTLIKTALVDITSAQDDDQKYQATLHALKEALAGFDTKRAKISCVVNCPQTSVRRIITPYMPKDELAAAVRLECKQSIPFSLDEAIWHFNVIEEVVDKGIAKLGIIVAAAPKSTIERLVSFFTLPKAKPFAGSITKKSDEEHQKSPLNLTVSGLLPLSLCVENIIEKSKLRINETLVTIEMGTDITELNIFKNARLYFSRKIPFAGKDLTHALTDALMTEGGRVQLSLTQAEQVKRKYGIPSITENKRIDEGITTNQILSLIRPILEQLVLEIERSFDFYHEKISSGKIDRIVLFGGASNLKGLPQFLTKELDVEVVAGNPLQDINVLKEGVVLNEVDAQRMVLAIGAALSGFKKINLLPPELKEKKTKTLRKMFLVALLAMPMAVSLLIYALMQPSVLTAQKHWDQLKAKLLSMDADLKGWHEQVKVEKILNTYPSMEYLLKHISRVMPKELYLTQLNIEENQLTIKGLSRVGVLNAQESIGQFMTRLGEGRLTHIRVTRSFQRDDKLSQVEFELVAEVIKNED